MPAIVYGEKRYVLDLQVVNAKVSKAGAIAFWIEPHSSLFSAHLRSQDSKQSIVHEAV